MKFVKVLLPLAAAALIMGTASARDYDGFYGKVEQMPATGNGDWVIGGKTFKADQRTNIDHGRDQNKDARQGQEQPPPAAPQSRGDQKCRNQNV